MLEKTEHYTGGISMRAYDIALFVHILGVIALFGAFVIHVRAGSRLRASSSVEQVHTWLGLLETTQPMFHGGSLMLLASGVFMTATAWRSPQAFITVGLIGVLTIWALSAAAGG